MLAVLIFALAVRAAAGPWQQHNLDLRGGGRSPGLDAARDLGLGEPRHLELHWRRDLDLELQRLLALGRQDLGLISGGDGGNLDLVGSRLFDLDVIVEPALDDSGGLDLIVGGNSWILTLASGVMADVGP